MRLLILGGSGQTGKLVIKKALSRGHILTALVRSPTSISELQSPSLQIIQGSPQQKDDLARAFTTSTPDVIIVTLGSNEEGFMTSVHRNLIELVTGNGSEGTTKIVTMQAFGAGSSNENVFWPIRMVLNYTSTAVGQRDHNMVEEVMRKSGLKWTLPRPVMLSTGEQKEVKDCGDAGEAKGTGLIPSVSRQSVAAFLLDIAEDESGRWIGRTPVISN
ncbi:hypothetical protein D0Z07_5965 [Hyphodiscus hymeniophilus]|uniref:NAD(P)-binding domain-containing protein n=1 Tax=Hyphodiscus hymeniophilus TaxID=353542 RepID=A0A9P7AWC9_9HELO|nr:hypothetical protein D0Z07_5965 [Hyphodiscus hymeniophilus]